MILKTMSDPKKNYVRAPDGKHLGWDLIHFWVGPRRYSCHVTAYHVA
jgi:hypothetical protein